MSPRALLLASVLLVAGCSSGSGSTGTPACKSSGGCATATECCSGICGGGTCGTVACAPQGGACAATPDCCAGLACTAGAPGSTCQPICRAVGDACTSDTQCCSGTYCAAGQCRTGTCSDLGGPCSDNGDCCRSPLRLTCDAYGTRTCACGGFAATCLGNEDCCPGSVCANHACHPASGTVADGGGCYLDAECKSGSCSAHGSGFTGQCCTSSGGSCESGSGAICCSGLVCFGEVDSPHACEACLDWTNSGPGKVACDPYGDCCANQDLACDPGTRGCFKRSGAACSDAAQCGPDHACHVPAGGTTAACCGELNAICYPASGAGCCDGFTCEDPGNGSSYYVCRRSPGQSCASADECARGDECLANRCCQHFGSCTTGSECCSGVCGADGMCGCAPQYGGCAKDGDCCGRAYAGSFGYAGPVCGGAVSTGANTCCPTPGDSCSSAADCCEAGDLCQVPATGTPATPVCCRAQDRTCWDDKECCTGSCGGNPLRCCVQIGASCAADADCCYGTGTYASQACSTTTHTCCLRAGQNPYTNAAACCSGRLDVNGLCK